MLNKGQCWTDLPDGVKLCPFWHGQLPRFVLDDLIVVNCFPVHDRESEGAGRLFVSDSEQKKHKKLHQDPEHKSAEPFLKDL